MAKHRIYISSTYNDLKGYRDTAYRALIRNRKCDVIWMENYVATDQRPLDKCLNDVANCDIYIGIFAWRYGFIPDKSNPDRKSITELEYRRASKMKKTCLIFLLDENTPWPDSLKDKHTGEGGQGRCIAELRQELCKDKVVRFFQTCDELALEVILAVSAIINPPEDQGRRDELKLLNRVKQNWIEGKLKGSLYNDVLIPLRMQRTVTHEEAVDPWAPEFEVPNNNYRILPEEENIGEIFNKVGQSLLILGEPGSGKTITLLELARDLIARAGLDQNEPIPVVFNLSSWDDKPQSLVDWLIAELRSKYKIPKEIGRHWLQKRRILPLLDGLDEVKQNRRASCAKAINEFSQEAGLTGLAVCCRRGEYEGLPSRPKLSGAILLLPLLPEQIDTYLESAGTKLSALRTALQTGEELQSMAQSPLMLSVMSLAYANISDEELTQTLDHRQHLFDTYINRMFMRKPGGEQPYTQDRTIDWLSRLARKMIDHSQSRFFIEELQPSWLSTKRQSKYYLFCCSLISGLSFGVSAALIRLLFEGPSLWALYYLILGIVTGSLIMPLLVIGKSYIDELKISDLPFFVMVKLCVMKILTEPTRIRGSEQLRWRWKDIKRAGFRGWKIGLVMGIVLGILEIRGFIQGRLSLREVGYHSISDVILFGILLMGLGGLLGGVSTGISAKKSTPNQGILLSLRNACVMGTGSALIIGIVFFIYLMKPYVPPYMVGDDELLANLGKLNYGLYGMLSQGVFYGLAIGMIYGCYSVIMHYVLRLFLYFAGQAPLRYAKFLGHAADRIFLVKVGGGYEFIHGLLLAHFALKSLSCEIEKHPERTDLYEERATIFFSAGDYRRVIGDLDQILRAEPDNDVIYLSRGECYRKLGNHEAAIRDVSRAIELRRDNLTYYRIRAGLYEEIGKVELALADLNSVVDLQKEDIGAYYERGLFHTRHDNDKLALDDLNKAIEILEAEWGGFVHLLRQLHNAFGDTIRDLYFERGKTHYNLKNFESSLMDLNRAVELQSENSQNYYQRGIIHYTIGNLESALIDLSEAIKRRPDNYLFYEWRGGFLQVRGEYAAAQADLDKALKLEPRASNSYFWRSLVFLNNRDVAQALEDLNKAIDLKPNASRFHFWCGVAYQLQGDLQTAQSHWTHATSLAQAESDVVEHQRMLAQVALLNGDKETARSHYIQSLEGSSEHHRLRTTLHYLQILSHLFYSREDICAVSRWFAKGLESHFSNNLQS